MKKSLLIPATGVAALLVSTTLAGCSSGAKTASSSSTASSTSASASSTSSAASTAAESTDTAHYADVTLPELPGWSDDPDVEWEEGNEFYHVAALKYGETPTSIQVLIARADKPGEDPLLAAQQIAGQLPTGCEPNGDPAPATMSGFNGFLNVFKCNNGTTATFQEAFGIQDTAAAPASVVLLLGVSSIDQMTKMTETLDLITSKGTIVP
ncbi:MAG: hypothetical protein WCK99_03905 [Mycobacteriaceae bacterium]